MRIFLDANILFSAAKSDGALRKLLTGLHSRGYTLVADGYVAAEARRNLELKIPAALNDFDALMGQVENSPRACAPLSAEIAQNLPEKDRPVLAAAIHHRCQVLLTGDRTHFGPLYGRTLQGVEILSPVNCAVKFLG